MNAEIWQTLSPDEQTSWLWQEFSRRLLEAVQPPPLQAGNDETQIMPGLTTLIIRREVKP